jgi:hypothetical protein
VVRSVRKADEVVPPPAQSFANPTQTPKFTHTPHPQVQIAPMTIEDQKKRMNGARNVIAELHATESAYLRMQIAFQTYFVQPLLSSNMLHQLILPPSTAFGMNQGLGGPGSADEVEKAFKYLGEILELSKKVERDLRMAKERDNGDAGLIVEVFLTNVSMWFTLPFE